MRRIATLVVVALLASVAAVAVAAPASAGQDLESAVELDDPGAPRFGEDVVISGAVQDIHTDCMVVFGIPTCFRPSGIVRITEAGSLIAEVALVPDAAPFGRSTFTTTAQFGVGPHTVVATYLGSDDFAPSSSQIGFLVGKADTQTGLVAGTGSGTSQFGVPLELRATVQPAAASGFVTFSQGAVAIGSAPVDLAGVATFTVSGLAPGSYTFTASYPGDGNYAPSTSEAVVHQVAVGATTMTLTSSDDRSVYGQPVTWTSTVSPVPPATATPEGAVTFTDGVSLTSPPISLADGTATFSSSALDVGSHIITATYPGSAQQYAGSSESIVQEVDKANTTVTVASSPNPSEVGDAINLTASTAAVAPGAGTPTGTIQFTNGGAPLGPPVATNAGVASVTVTGLNAGSFSFGAVYSGDQHFNGSSGATAHTVRCTLLRVFTNPLGLRLCLLNTVVIVRVNDLLSLGL